MRKRLRSRKWRWIIIWIILAVVAFIYVDLRIQKSLLEIAKSKAQIRGVEMINKIVNDKVVAQIKYEDLVIVHKDDKGHVVLLQPNTIMFNKMMSNTVIEITASLNELKEESIPIPLGQLTGSKMLAAAGPRFNVRIIPAGQVNVEVMDKFEQAGINQTRHLIYFQIDHTLRIAVPFMADEIKVRSTIPLAETIIIGDVPQTYVHFKGEKEFLYPFIKNKDLRE
ncbi:sporulation protein YunB [Thermosyntropha lipolytica DSM 11003]|uniref:Sporulation protein YunB n=1 Tax=Thermosyntropha lipolytica DSM 11003 TaxID=1123382 RepID=A0A1M5PVA9_9FIRM|nr:sporulation protein YunB [Thermosyntropha lipolytica]SHH05967.1 sporulation protein YunB [Thermosyntropha lipolytica DSM 11003]